MKAAPNLCPGYVARCTSTAAGRPVASLTVEELHDELSAVQSRETELRTEILRRQGLSACGPRRERVASGIASILGNRTAHAKVLVLELIAARVVSTPAAGYQALSRATRAGVLERVDGGYRVAVERAADSL